MSIKVFARSSVVAMQEITYVIFYFNKIFETFIIKEISEQT